MNKVAGAVIAMFTTGAGLMALMGPVLGAYTEPVTLSLLGVALFTGGTVLGGSKDTVPAGVAKEA